MDVVDTCPSRLWDEWIAEGDLPGQPWSGLESHFWISGTPDIHRGERVYIVARDHLRGYAPLVRLERSALVRLLRSLLIRYGIQAGGAGVIDVATKVQSRYLINWREKWQAYMTKVVINRAEEEVA